MNVETTVVQDGLGLAAMVRRLAHDAHRLITAEAGSDPREVGSVLRRAAELRRRIRGQAGEELRTWLENLAHRVEQIPGHATRAEDDPNWPARADG